MPRVVVIGGGVAGMSAAHELVERGFEVCVLERQPVYVGGKARSVDVPNSNLQNSSLFLPGEHGFRFFPGFYKHITDTFERIPIAGGGNVLDNLRYTESVVLAQQMDTPISMPVNFPTSLKDLITAFQGFLAIDSELQAGDIEFFCGKIWQLMTSCQKRFDEEYDDISWWDFTEAASRSSAYQRILAGGLTLHLVACKPQTASTRTGGAIFLQLLYLMMQPGLKLTDRVLNGPTNEAWLHPWRDYLKDRGVAYLHSLTASELIIEDGEISGVRAKGPQGLTEQTFSGDYFILAVPVERAAELINEKMLVVDEGLKNVIRLSPNVEWMNGIQYYLNTVPQFNKGHTIYSNSNWALTSILQTQFWEGYDLRARGDGRVRSILSVDISNWNSPGNFNGKTAKDCTPEEISKEVWSQIQSELRSNPSDPKSSALSDEMLHSWFLDSSIVPVTAELTEPVRAHLSQEQQDQLLKVRNLEPLLINQIGTWKIRPEASTGIPNLFLASDYVRTNTDLATMEGANEAARCAVNGILKTSGSNEKPCETWPLHTPLILEPFRTLDLIRYELGKAWQHPDNPKHAL